MPETKRGADQRPADRAPEKTNPRADRALAFLARCALVASTTGGRDRRISAMMRLRDEAEFLEAAVGSIIDAVDQVVLIDNLSSDDTPRIISRLQREHPRRIAVHRYPHEVARYGAETWRLSTTGSRVKSPHLSSNYYNWCLRRCRGPYVLKWDGDMIALPGLREALTEWKRGGHPVLFMHGANVHPDLEHLIAARNEDRESLLRGLEVPGLPIWATSLTYDYPEPRLFPKLFARYTSRIWWVEVLKSPFLKKPVRNSYGRELAEPSYLHMKFCKRDPLAAYSSDLSRVIASNVAVGPPLTAEQRSELTNWELRSVHRMSSEPVRSSSRADGD